MSKILGLDLGTNSIGWAIRITDEDERKEFLVKYKSKSPTSENGNQIVDSNVIVFKKGVGDGKTGEFSLAAERRTNRGKRRLYNAKRYRKWELLKALIEIEMCPLTVEELKLWSIGEWKKENGKWKNTGRKYPMSEDWLAWLAMDEKFFGHNGIITNNHDGKLSYKRKSPYDLRSELLNGFESNEKKRKNKIGRALYHLVQRRGFKTSRKSGKSSYGENDKLKKFYEKYPDKGHWKSSQVFNWMQSSECSDSEMRINRIRNSGVLQRHYYEDELRTLCDQQQLSLKVTEKLHKAIYDVRGVRSQKGLVGTCTLEKGKPRIPISYPLFEEFRAVSFINNLQWRETGSKKPFVQLPIEVRNKIFEELFFRKISRGENKGRISTESFFKFEDLIDAFSEMGKWEFNYRNKPNVSVCPVIAGLMNVFDEEWKDKFITDESKIGINWNGLKLDYQLQYVSPNQEGIGLKRKGKKFIQKNIGDVRTLKYDDIWHLLFDFILTKDDEEGLKKFCREVLKWNDEKKIDAFADIAIQQGYGSLSKNAIAKILPFLHQGKIYSEAVSFANLSKVLGAEMFEKKKEEITKSISQTIGEVDAIKEKLNIVNGLIQQYFGETNSNRAKGVDEKLRGQAEIDVDRKLKNYFGEDNWNSKNEDEQKDYFESVLDNYLRFLDGQQSDEEKASSSQLKIAPTDYYKLPRLDEAIKKTLKKNFGAMDDGLKNLYHPSDIDIYPKAKEDKLGSPQPPSKGWKNPMAMRTMHELRKLLQYLIDIGKIDRETKVVVEMARELNDANKRWAIQYYQRKREEENIEFGKAIIGVAKEKYPNLNEADAANIDKIRLWWEQLENGEELYKQIKALKEDVQKYRLWKEQQCQCMYTGKLFDIADLFDGTKTQFEHTFPASDSFDNSLTNLTVCDAHYNMNIKKDQIPTQLPNYNAEWNGYSAIEKRIDRWVRKRDSLQERIKNNNIETKKAIRRGDIDWKNKLIRDRHLLQFDFDYWDKKVKTFTLKEIPNWWKNSQLVDTQIISKYARAYLKSYFRKVDVQKGIINSEFRKIYGIMGDEKKDRSKHSHHAKDAAVLTLIPGSARREDILKRYYKSIEEHTEKSFEEIPYAEFHITHVLDIEKNAFINHTNNDRTLVATKKKARKRGRVQKTKDGKVIWKQGDSIRGQLHDASYFGAIKAPERDEHGYAKKENGKYSIRQKEGEEEIWIVAKKPIAQVDISKDKIVDELLKQHIEKQLTSGTIKSIAEAIDFSGKKIRHLRCRVKSGGGGYLKKAIEIRKHSHQPRQKHKQYILARNSTDGNYLYLIYENEHNQKLLRKARIVTLFETSAKDFPGIKGMWNDRGHNQLDEIPLKHIVKAGDRSIFYSENKDELKELSESELKNRVFVVYKFNESGTPDIYMKNMMEARPNPEIDKLCENSFDPKKYQASLSLKVAKLNCVFEGKEFEIKPDGEVKWLY